MLDNAEVRQLFHNYLKQYNNEEPFLFVNAVNEYVLLLSSANRFVLMPLLVIVFCNRFFSKKCEAMKKQNGL